MPGDDDVRLRRFDLLGMVLVEIEMPLPPGGAEIELTTAEREVAALVFAGLEPREIAARRGGSVRAVSIQVAAIYRKLGVSSRAELVARLGDD